MAAAFEPTEKGRQFPVDDIRHWLSDDERRVLDAFDCADLHGHVSVSVKLTEFVGKKRNPYKLTDEQRARERAASELIDARFGGYANVRELLSRLAIARWEAAGTPTRSGAEMDVLCERVKQRQKWGDAHDDRHEDGELAGAAAFLADPEYVEDDPASLHEEDGWAIHLRAKHRADRRQQLVIAAALLLAEIERIDRKGGA
jgi:hypothetical protein